MNFLVTVKITLIDVNDNYPIIDGDAKLISSLPNEAPVFEKLAKVKENSKYGTKVSQIIAHDFDKDRNITFTIREVPNQVKYLTINQLTGKFHH